MCVCCVHSLVTLFMVTFVQRNNEIKDVQIVYLYLLGDIEEE